MTVRMPRLRRYFLVGLVVLAPVGVTLVILRWMFETIDSILGTPLQATLGVRIPGFGFLLLAVIVLIIGWVVHRAVGRRILQTWNQTLARFPIAGRVYNAASQIVQSVAGDQARVFKRTVLVPFPIEGMWSMGFVTHEETAVLSAFVGVPCLNVFVPTTPNPTSGLLMVVPRDKVISTDIPVEEGIKFVISAGAMVPLGGSALVARRGLDLDDLFRERAR